MNVAALNNDNNEPHSVEAEQQVLGALLLDGSRVQAVQSCGGADLFYDPVHAEIYKLVAGMERRGVAVTPVTVKAALSSDLMDMLKGVNGAGYLARLAGSAISPNLIHDYVDVMIEARAKRDLMAVVRTATANLARSEMSAADIAAQIEAALSGASRGSTAIKPVSITKAVTDALSQAYSAFQGEGEALITTGIGALDRIYAGFGAGELVLIGGRPSMGKTGVALSLALNAARCGHPVVIASLEMTPAAMAMRAISEQTARDRYAVAYASMRRGDFTDRQGEAMKAAASEIASLPITFLPRQYQDADLLQVGVKQSLRGVDGKMPLVVVDYAQLMKSKAKTRYEQITDISLALKGMAMDLEAPVVALSQLSRSLESRDDKRPMLSDLRESGQLEQDADAVMFCYRDEYYIERTEPDRDDMDKWEGWKDRMEKARNKLEIIVAKQRQGEIGTAHMRFNPALNLIWEG